MSKQESSGPNRRKALRGAATAAGVAGLGSAATAKSDSTLTSSRRKELIGEFKQPAAVKRAVNERSGLIEELAADDVLPEARIDDLEELSEPSGGHGELITVDQFNTQYTPRVKIFRKVEAGYLSISVFPEMDTAHAVLNPVEDGEPMGEGDLQMYGDMPEPEPQGCVDPGHCQDCSDCDTVCCDADAGGACLQYCTQ